MQSSYYYVSPSRGIRFVLHGPPPPPSFPLLPSFPRTEQFLVEPADYDGEQDKTIENRKSDVKTLSRLIRHAWDTEIIFYLHRDGGYMRCVCVGGGRATMGGGGERGGHMRMCVCDKLTKTHKSLILVCTRTLFRLNPKS